MQTSLDTKEAPQSDLMKAHYASSELNSAFDFYDLDFEITIPKDSITMGPQSNSCPWACTATCGGSCTPPKCY